MMHKIALASALGLCLAGCGSSSSDVPACDKSMPVASELLADPVFKDLSYHKHTDFQLGRNLAYDLWGDAKFDYRTGVEFSLAPVKDRKTPTDLCVTSVAMRVFLPATDDQKAKLRAFVRAMSARASLDAPALESRIAGTLASRDKYRPVVSEKAIAVQAGKLDHPSRGEFFLVTFSLPRSQ